MFGKSSEGLLKHFDFIVLDMASLQLAFAFSYLLRYGLSNPYANYLYRTMAIFLMTEDLILFSMFDTFDNVLKRGYYREFVITVKHVLQTVLLEVVYLFMLHNGEPYSRIIICTSAVLYLIFTYTTRVCWKKYIKKRSEKDLEARSLLIITSSDIVEDVVFHIRDNNYEMFHIAGLVITDKDMVGQTVAGISVVANEKTVVDYVCKKWVDEVFINLSKEHPLSAEMIDIFTETGVTVHVNLAILSDVSGKKQLIEKIGDYTVLTTSMNIMTPREVAMKRLLDILGGLVGCLITGVLFVFLAPIIYIQSPGPIFFAQPRVGKNGKIFKMYKFRSMYLDAEERKKELMEQNQVKSGLMFKMEFDPRVIGNKILPDGTRKTGIGEFIRKTSLDEFPQFWNVLKGELSIVGTRACLESEYRKYSPHHCARMAVKPGITGMWQVSGRSKITDFEEVVRLDKKYINEWSIELDLKIILKTLKVVLTGDGAM